MIVARKGAYRWVVVALLFAAIVINYIDRQTIGLLKPHLSREMGWSEGDYADLVVYFQLTYALAYLAWGGIVDRIGARWGLGLAFAIWQIAHIAHAAAHSLGGFIAARMALGVGEAGGFPASLKAIVEWFPAHERALATGIFNAGTNIGAILTPLIIPAITLAYGWRAALIITGLLGLIWLPIWLLVYKAPGTQADEAVGQADPAETWTISWSQLLRRRETWAYALGKFLIDPIWWMFLFWLPDFLAKRHGLDLKTFGPPLVAIYILSDIGSVAGGWLSSRLLKAGWTVNRARKTAMLVCALCAIPVMGASLVENLWLAVAIIGLATAAHQGFSANLYTLPSDIFPARAVGSVIGIGGTLGALGGMVMAKYAGYVLDNIGNYTPIFIVAGSAYLVALLVIHLLTPSMSALQPGSFGIARRAHR